jgi:hypothetical protein
MNTDRLLLEDGSFLLLEDGGKFLLESSVFVPDLASVTGDDPGSKGKRKKKRLSEESYEGMWPAKPAVASPRPEPSPRPPQTQPPALEPPPAPTPSGVTPLPKMVTAMLGQRVDVEQAVALLDRHAHVKKQREQDDEEALFQLGVFD